MHNPNKQLHTRQEYVLASLDDIYHRQTRSFLVNKLIRMNCVDIMQTVTLETVEGIQYKLHTAKGFTYGD